MEKSLQNEIQFVEISALFQKVKNLAVKKFEGWISKKTAFLKAKADIYETGAKMSLTHHKQNHEIWPGSGNPTRSQKL